MEEERWSRKKPKPEKVKDDQAQSSRSFFNLKRGFMSPSADGDDVEASDGTQLLTLSLFIVLLAFFIVLNQVYVLDQVRVQSALTSINQTFGADAFSTSDALPSFSRSDAGSSGSGFSSARDFKAYMQDSFSGFDLKITEVGEGEIVAQLYFEKEVFYRHFKYIARKMAAVYKNRGSMRIKYEMSALTDGQPERYDILNLSKIAAKMKPYGVPLPVLDMMVVPAQDTDGFMLRFFFSEAR